MSQLEVNATANNSQTDYEPTAYEDSSWEVVGELVETKEFVPMQVNILPTTITHMDPMFADYGGIPENPQAQRWHLPQELLVSERAKRSPDKAVDQVAKIELLAEELAATKQESFEQGRLAGIEEAALQANERMAATEERVYQLIKDLDQQVKEHQLQTEKRAVQLVLGLTEKLIYQAVEINPEYIIPMIKEGLGLAATAQVKRIKVSPQDYEFIQLMGINKAMQERDDSWEFVAEDSIRAGCVFETSAGEIDYDLNAAFSRVKEQVLKAIK